MNNILYWLGIYNVPHLQTLIIENSCFKEYHLLQVQMKKDKQKKKRESRKGNKDGNSIEGGEDNNKDKSSVIAKRPGTLFGY